ncbi:MAG: AAA family ATPase [Candidatus Electrothrix sp. YB6]
MQYIKECLQLLYWIYFKPYTLKQYVREICPEITDPYNDNIYRRSAETRANPRLKRYDDQVWWLTALVPIATIFLYAPLADSISRLIVGTAVLQLNWWLSYFFSLGWLLGQIFLRIVRKRAVWPVIISVITLPIIFMLKYNFLNEAAIIVAVSIIVSIAIDGAVSAVGGVAIGAAVGATIGIAGSTTVGIAGGVTVGVAVGVAVGRAFAAVFSGAEVVAGSVVIVMGSTVFVVMFGAMTVATTVEQVTTIAFGVSFIVGVLRLCFWLLKLPYLLFPNNQACSKLDLLFPQFDQFILPMPFLPGLIAKAYQENQAAARQTVNHLISSTNQQKAASKAMLLIAAEEFRRCWSAEDIAEVRKKLDWLSAEQAGQITTCLDLSQDTDSALNSTTPFRREERLKKVCARIDQQRNALAAASAREATALGAVLDHWQRILETARKTLREQAAQSDEIPPVYLPGPTLEPDKAGRLFKGRRDLFHQIESLLLSAQPPTLVMQGNRRSGKSSALRYLPRQMPSDILPLFVDLQGALVSISLHGLAKGIADQIAASAHTTHRLSLSPPDKEELKTDPFAALLGWLDMVEQAAPSKTFLLCLDEFERIEEIVTASGSQAPLNFLRHLIQHRDRWQLLFAGAHTPDELTPHWSDCLINTRSLRVSYLDKNDALELICRPVPDFPAIWPDGAAEAVWQLTQGQPYLIQLLCSEAVDHLNRNKTKAVQPGDVEAILPAAFEHGHYYFDEFWNALNDAQRKLLRAVAEEREPIEETGRAASMLVRKEILAQEDNGWSFRVPLLQRWILTGQEKEATPGG